MFENIGSFFNKIIKKEQKELLAEATSKDAAKERLHIVLMQDRANVSADFLDLMKQEIIDVIKKYIVIDEEQIDVRLTNQENEDGTTGAPSLYANIPILNIRNDIKGEVLNQTVQNVQDCPKIQVKNDKNEVDDYEEDEDDVTFDDLLKVAEAEELQQKQELETQNQEQVSNIEEPKLDSEIKQSEDVKEPEDKTSNEEEKSTNKKTSTKSKTTKSSKTKKKSTKATSKSKKSSKR